MRHSSKELSGKMIESQLMPSSEIKPSDSVFSKVLKSDTLEELVASAEPQKVEEAAKEEESRKKSNSSRKTIVSSRLRMNRETNCLKFDTNNIQTIKKTKITNAVPA